MIGDVSVFKVVEIAVPEVVVIPAYSEIKRPEVPSILTSRSPP